jgi:hypothetical protein
MIDLLRRHDPGLVELAAADGSVLVSPGLQGRIFAHLEGDLLHQLDLERLETPVPGEFNNLGGNSLWPAPEGGPFAFNYMPGSDEWVVQAGIADQRANITSHGDGEAEIEKQIELTNRHGTTLKLRFMRNIQVAVTTDLDGFPDVKGITYHSTDTFEPLGSYTAGEALLAPWSLEQFPGGNGVTAFAKAKDPATAINFDFYGLPESPPVYGEDFFSIELGGTARFQIGIKVANGPEVLGALDANRNLLFLRVTERRDGLYFNIADNDQPDGPESAADMYSVFNGGELDFFELETIAPMQIRDGKMTTSSLISTSLLMRGPVPELKRWVREHYGIDPVD